MDLIEIFYCTFWISCLAVIWFYTDWFIHYTDLFNIVKTLRSKYILYIEQNPDKYFPDFLYSQSLYSSNRLYKFVCKIISCPFCMLFWLANISAWICANPIIAAPTYIFSLIIVLQIKKIS